MKASIELILNQRYELVIQRYQAKKETKQELSMRKIARQHNLSLTIFYDRLHDT